MLWYKPFGSNFFSRSFFSWSPKAANGWWIREKVFFSLSFMWFVCRIKVKRFSVPLFSWETTHKKKQIIDCTFVFVCWLFHCSKIVSILFGYLFIVRCILKYEFIWFFHSSITNNNTQKCTIIYQTFNWLTWNVGIWFCILSNHFPKKGGGIFFQK